MSTASETAPKPPRPPSPRPPRAPSPATTAAEAPAPPKPPAPAKKPAAPPPAPKPDSARVAQLETRLALAEDFLTKLAPYIGMPLRPTYIAYLESIGRSIVS